MFCPSKGLSCPIGSIVAGSQVLIEKIRKWRKILGDGCGKQEKMVDRLRDDHKNTRVLSEKLTKMERISISLQTVKAKILISNIFGPKMTASEFV
jgi:threonine aldolase